MFNMFKGIFKKKKFFKKYTQFFNDFANVRNKYVDFHTELSQDWDKVDADPKLRLLVYQLDVILFILSSERPLFKNKQTKSLDDDYEHLKKIVDPPPEWLHTYSDDLTSRFVNLNVELFEKCFIPYYKTIGKGDVEKRFSNILNCYSDSVGIVLLSGYSVRYNNNSLNQEWIINQVEKVKKLYS